MMRTQLRRLAITTGLLGAAAFFTALPSAQAADPVRHLGQFGSEQYYQQMQRRHHGMTVPELDPSSGATGLALLVGGAALMMRRRRRA